MIEILDKGFFTLAVSGERRCLERFGVLPRNSHAASLNTQPGCSPARGCQPGIQTAQIRKAGLTLVPQGDRAVNALFPNEISEDVNRQVLALCAAVDAARVPGVVNCVPSYRPLPSRQNLFIRGGGNRHKPQGIAGPFRGLSTAFRPTARSWWNTTPFC